MVFSLMPNSILRLFVDKELLRLHDSLDAIPLHKIHNDSHYIYFNITKNWQYNFEYSNDPNAIAIWHANSDYGLGLYKKGIPFYGGNVTFASAAGLIPARILFFRLVRSKQAEINRSKIKEHTNNVIEFQKRN